MGSILPTDMFTLLDGETELTSQQQLVGVIGPLTCVRHCQKTISLHTILEQMGRMDGSRNVGRISQEIADDPNLLQLETKRHFYVHRGCSQLFLMER